MSTITLDLTAFRALFPQFADQTKFPDLVITMQFSMATSYISSDTYGCMSVEARTNALYLMTAHLLALNVIIAAGGYSGQPGVVTQSHVGDVSVTLAQPPYGTSTWRYWLSLSPYGQQLLALLDSQAVGGFFVGGLPERDAFRKVGGIF